MGGVGLQYGNGKVQSIGSTAMSGILDSGTSYILLPTSNYEVIKNDIAKKVGVTFTPVNSRTKIQWTDCNDKQFA